jgi:hypothetical protein
MFKHFIITRYNVKPDGENFGKHHAINTEKWMDHRFSLFRDFCFPSIVNQTNQNFVWLIFLNADTKPVFSEQISSLINEHKHFRTIFIDGFGEFFKTLRSVIHEEMQGEKYLITSRLDNDDCIRRDFIQEVQNQFQMQHKCIIDFPHGLSLEIEPRIRLAFRKITMNPFISLIENAASFHTVMYYFGHRQWKNSGAEIISIKHRRVWMQVIHKYNVSNTFKGFWLTGGFDLTKKFGLPQSLQVYKPDVLSQMRQFLYAFLMRFKSRMS